MEEIPCPHAVNRRCTHPLADQRKHGHRSSCKWTDDVPFLPVTKGAEMADTEESGDPVDANAQKTITDLLRGNVRQERTIKDVKKAAERALSDRAAAGGTGATGGSRGPFW